MERFLDFSGGVDINLLDDIVKCVYNGTEHEHRVAQQVLTQFQEHPNAWQQVPQILEESKNAHSQFLALQTLERLIQTRWEMLPKDQKDGIRHFTLNFILKLTSDEARMRKEKTLLNKLNLTLVQILKQEWPHSWFTFIPEIIQSSRSSLIVCENSMVILRLLSEEVFDFSAEQMTQSKAKFLKLSLEVQFEQIFQLCQEVLEKALKHSLIEATLETLLRFLSWIPLNFVFETSLIDMLLTRFLETLEFRNVTLRCLSEIAILNIDKKYDPKFVILFAMVVTSINRMIPPNTDIAAAYRHADDDGQELVLNLALFLSNFLSFHLHAAETPRCRDVLLNAHLYLIKISQIRNREIFKICIEYWIRLAADLYEEIQNTPVGNDGLLRTPTLNTTIDVPDDIPLRKDIYADVLSNLRLVMIEQMVKPEEVILVKTEEGEIVREFMKDNDAIILHKSMRKLLVYLTHLDVIDTESILIEKLSRQIDGSEWSTSHLNSLCWSIGSISGAMDEESEKRFLVTVIKDLLGLCEMKNGKENKIAITSNIMYIVGQYPRFLKGHWMFLKTVVNKLFEFMRENHQGIQEMASDTLIKIAQKCGKQFVIQQAGEVEPYIDVTLRTLPQITQKLMQQQQLSGLYEAVGYMISAQPNKAVRERLMERLMDRNNVAWDNLMLQAGSNLDMLDNIENLKSIATILKSNIAACTSIGTFYLPQLGRIYLDMLGLYKAISDIINETNNRDGLIASKNAMVWALRGIRKDILKLLETYFEVTDDLDAVNNNLVPPLLDAVLGNYASSSPISREAEVLNLISTVASRLEDRFISQVPACLDVIFESTLNMINKDFIDFPEHRIAFFNLLCVINHSCFIALPAISPTQFNVFMDSIIWAIKHPMRDIADLGLSLCADVLGNFSGQTPEIANEFHQKFYLRILQDIFWVITDADHKSGFHLQSQLLAHLIRLAQTGQVRIPLSTAVSDQNIANSIFTKEYIVNLLHGHFQHLGVHHIQDFMDNLFQQYNDLGEFRSTLRDFLIQLKEFSGDNTDLFIGERKIEAQQRARLAHEVAVRIPGMLKPSEMEEV